MEETGRVIEVGNGITLVSTTAKGACDSCSARGVCHMGGQKTMEVEVWNSMNAGVGDEVRIRLSGRSTLTAAFLLYLLPLLMFLLGVMLGQHLIGQQVWPVVFGLALMAATYGIIRAFDRRIRRSAKMRPEIVEIIKPASKSETG